MAKILRVNLDRQDWQLEEPAPPYVGLGGRGLSSKIIATEVPPTCDPLGKENKLVFACGIFAGSSVPNGGRLSVGAKSPLTQTIKEANSGGSAAQKLARLGIGAVIIEGCSESLTRLTIKSDGVAFTNASEFKGAGNYEVVNRLRLSHGENIGVISIGPAGEMQLKASAVATTTPDFHIRTASRGGLGAVMGSKNLKAIVIDDRGGSAPKPANPDVLSESVKQLASGIASHPLTGALQTFGTPLLINMINEMGALATRNYRQGRFEGAEKISGESLGELLKNRPNAKAVHRCMTGCIVQCSNVLTDVDGEVIVSGLEFETIALMGSNCMIDDIDAVARLNRICNDVGIDTMDAGAAIAIAMEAGLIPWGDAEQAIGLVRQIAEGGDQARLIGNGCLFTGNKLGVNRVPQVKGQSLAGYDPRVLKGTGVTYATSSMGADHTCGNALPSPANPNYNPSAATGQGPVSKFLQAYFAAIDTLGICLFASIPVLEVPELQPMLISCASAILGTPLGPDYLMSLGESVLTTERAFNLEAGFTDLDDRLPEFFLKESISPSGNIFDVPVEELNLVNSN